MKLLGVANLKPILRTSEDMLDLRELLGLVAKFPFQSADLSAEGKARGV